MTVPRVLIVNPPVYDFSAYDFWVRPLGVLSVAGLLREQAQMVLFDFMDRRHPAAVHARTEKDPFGRGKFIEQRIAKPSVFEAIPRYYKRFGLPRQIFQDFLRQSEPFDAVFIQSVMSYWYPGIKESIEDIRRSQPQAKIIIGGFYATACYDHAQSLGADVVVKGDDLEPVWKIPGLTRPKDYSPPAWDLYPNLGTGVILLTRGCPFQCSYCYTPVRGEKFRPRPLHEVIADFEIMRRLGVRNIAFYDDALLYKPQEILQPFLDYVRSQGCGVNFHTPNAMHVRMLNSATAGMMVQSGVKTFYLGYESSNAEFQKQTGAKAVCEELESAVDALRSNGVKGINITAYEMLGHPLADVQAIEESMRYAHRLGIRVMLSEFSPIPGTPDGELCRNYADLTEPLNHNKSAFPILFLGRQKVQYCKNLCRQLNARNFGSIP